MHVSVASTGHCVTPSTGQNCDTSASVSLKSCNKPKKNRGATKVFDQNGFLTVEVTEKIKDQLHGRNCLAENEIELIHFLLSSYSNGD